MTIGADRPIFGRSASGDASLVDASIWVLQLLKAMRGELLPGAHVLGFLRRVCKLLFLRVRPLIVLDCATPALKHRTVLARRRQRENAQIYLRWTAEKLLLYQVRVARGEKGVADDGQISPPPSPVFRTCFYPPSVAYIPSLSLSSPLIPNSPPCSVSLPCSISHLCPTPLPGPLSPLRPNSSPLPIPPSPPCPIPSLRPVLSPPLCPVLSPPLRPVLSPPLRLVLSPPLRPVLSPLSALSYPPLSALSYPPLPALSYHPLSALSYPLSPPCSIPPLRPVLSPHSAMSPPLSLFPILSPLSALS
ncbi:unnamed protein product [Closterium sp. Naga37s-1]|nr:unnamed protein product [Closterium sp. Naga37s-1]